MHVISAPEARNLENDIQVFKQIIKNIKEIKGIVPPIIIVLNKIDTLGNRRHWPPDNYDEKIKLIVESIDYMANTVLRLPSKNIDPDNKLTGRYIEDTEYVGIVPVCSFEEDYWNIEGLSNFISQHLPFQARLFFCQAKKRKKLLKNLSSEIIKAFTQIAAGIGASPIPISDIAVLSPLQLLLIAIIGGFSCRSLSKKTAFEFLSAAGLNVTAGIGLRFLSQTVLKLIPGYGWAASAGIAAGGTYTVGKSAESYFFNGKVEDPRKFTQEYNKE